MGIFTLPKPLRSLSRTCPNHLVVNTLKSFRVRKKARHGVDREQVKGATNQILCQY